jgi:hypothetical protein
MYDDLVDAENESYDFYASLEEAEDTYTLTDDDYALSSNSNIVSAGYVTADADYEEAVAEILYYKYYTEDESVIEVTFNVVDGEVDYDDYYELSDDDYSDMGQSYSTFSSTSAAATAIASWLDDNYGSTASDGDEKTIVFDLYGVDQTRYFSVDADYNVTLLDEEPATYYELDSDDYDELGRSYDDFYTVESAESYLATLAAMDGYGAQNYACEVYINETYIVFEFDGLNFVYVATEAYTDTQNFQYTLVASEYEGAEYTDYVSSYWTYTSSVIYLSEIAYTAITLTTEDYDSNDLTSYYDNLDLRSSDDSDYSLADDGDRAEAIGAMLELNHSAVSDAYYLVSYDYYDGSSGTATELFIKTDDTWTIESYQE